MARRTSPPTYIEIVRGELHNSWENLRSIFDRFLPNRSDQIYQHGQELHRLRHHGAGWIK